MPISNIFDTSRFPFLSLKIQGAILAVDVFLIAQGIKNIYLCVSILTIVVLFILQLINRRFLLLFPKFGWVDVKSESIDTYLLYFLIFLSTAFTLLGIFHIEIGIIRYYGYFFRIYVLPGMLFIYFVIILIYLKYGKKLNQCLLTKKIKNSLRKKPFNRRVFFNCKHCGSIEALRKRTLGEWNLGTEKIVCSKCERLLSFEICKPQLGEVKIEKEIITIRLVN